MEASAASVSSATAHVRLRRPPCGISLSSVVWLLLGVCSSVLSFVHARVVVFAGGELEEAAADCACSRPFRLILPAIVLREGPWTPPAAAEKFKKAAEEATAASAGAADGSGRQGNEKAGGATSSAEVGGSSPSVVLFLRRILKVVVACSSCCRSAGLVRARG